MTNGPGAVLAEIVENSLPKARARRRAQASALLRGAQPHHRFPEQPIAQLHRGGGRRLRFAQDCARAGRPAGTGHRCHVIAGLDPATRAHHRLVTLAKSSPSRSTPRPSQKESATVMLSMFGFLQYAFD